MRIIVLSGSSSVLPTLVQLHKTNNLSALLCPCNNIAEDSCTLQGWAERNDLPCWQVEAGSWEEELHELIDETEPDLLLVFGFPYPLPDYLLNKVEGGALNVHFAFHLENRGSITVHQLAKRLNHVQSLRQCNVSLLPDVMAGSSINQLSLLATALVKASIKSITNSLQLKDSVNALN